MSPADVGHQVTNLGLVYTFHSLCFLLTIHHWDGAHSTALGGIAGLGLVCLYSVHLRVIRNMAGIYGKLQST